MIIPIFEEHLLRNMSRLIPSFLIAFIVSASLPANAQAEYEYNMYKDSLGVMSILYRGRQATSYNHLSYNGHCYWQTSQFCLGSVCLNGKTYDGVFLNIDASEQQLLVRATESSAPIVIPRDRVTTFSIDNLSFVNLKTVRPDLKSLDGFYQLLKDGDEPLYYRSDKTLLTSTESVNGMQGIGYDDPGYNPAILNAFIITRGYFVLRDGKLKKISARKASRILYE